MHILWTLCVFEQCRRFTSPPCKGGKSWLRGHPFEPLCSRVTTIISLLYKLHRRTIQLKESMSEEQECSLLHLSKYVHDYVSHNFPVYEHDGVHILHNTSHLNGPYFAVTRDLCLPATCKSCWLIHISTVANNWRAKQAHLGVEMRNISYLTVNRPTEQHTEMF